MYTTLIQKAVVAQFVTEAFESFHEQHLPALLTDDFIAHPWAGEGVPRGPEGMAQVVRGLRAIFGGARVTVGAMAAEADVVAARYLFEAVHASGRPVRMSGILIARMEGEKIAEYWREEDQLGLVRQLGAEVAVDALAVA